MSVILSHNSFLEGPARGSVCSLNFGKHQESSSFSVPTPPRVSLIRNCLHDNEGLNFPGGRSRTWLLVRAVPFPIFDLFWLFYGESNGVRERLEEFHAVVLGAVAAFLCSPSTLRLNDFPPGFLSQRPRTRTPFK